MFKNLSGSDSCIISRTVVRYSCRTVVVPPATTKKDLKIRINVVPKKTLRLVRLRKDLKIRINVVPKKILRLVRLRENLTKQINVFSEIG